MVNAAFSQKTFNNCPYRLLSDCFCCSNQECTSYIARRIAAVSISILESHQWTVHPKRLETGWINEQTYGADTSRDKQVKAKG